MGDLLCSNPARGANTLVKASNKTTTLRALASLPFSGQHMSQRESNQKNSAVKREISTNEQQVGSRESCPGCGPAPKSVRR